MTTSNPLTDTVVSYNKSSENQKTAGLALGFSPTARWGKHQRLGQTPIGNHPNSFRQILLFNTACQARLCAVPVA
jgi:hypothetical protein